MIAEFGGDASNCWTGFSTGMWDWIGLTIKCSFSAGQKLIHFACRAQGIFPRVPRGQRSGAYYFNKSESMGMRRLCTSMSCIYPHILALILCLCQDFD